MKEEEKVYNIDDIKNTILQGDAISELRKIPDNSIDTCVTSPPYWNLRDYNNENQLGQEEDFKMYIEKMINIFEEVYRVLKPEGSCWVNLGDTYSSKTIKGVKRKSLIGIPERFKIEMIDKGWICRNEIIWHKPNAMPCSSKDRFNNDYEKMFFFTKNEKYFFETQYEERKSKVSKNNGNKRKGKYENSNQEKQVRQGMNKERGSKLIVKRDLLPSQDEFLSFINSKVDKKTLIESTDIKKTTIDHWYRKDKTGFSYPSIDDWNKIKHLIDDWSGEFEEFDKKMTHVIFEYDDIEKNHNKGRIKRAVWSISTKSFKGKHFATFPEELITTPIKASTPKNGIVLDIFMGSGTTGVVAKKNGFDYIGIELNEEYKKIADERIKNVDKYD